MTSCLNLNFCLAGIYTADDVIEQRRLVKLGRSTLVVSLPAEWVKKHRLKAGDMLLLQVSDTYIKIVPAKKDGKEIKAIIEVVNDARGLYRAIISSYIAGADVIEVIVNKEDLILEALKQIKYAISHLIGIEIVDQDINRFVLQTFINVDEQDLNSLVRKMASLIKIMIKYILQSNEAKNYIEDLENEVDKLYRLALRRLNLEGESEALMSSLLTSLENASDAIPPLLENLKNVKGILDILNLSIEMLDFISSYEIGSGKITEINDKTDALEHIEKELSSRLMDERLKYRSLMLLHHIKNALLSLLNIEITNVVRNKQKLTL